MANKEIIVQFASTDRLFTKCYHDFIDCNLLNGEEKIIFLILKRFLDVKSDNGNVFPTIETIQKMTGWGNQKVIKYINSLRRKGIVKKIRQGLNKPNIYILSDYPAMWTAENVEDMKKAAANQGIKPMTAAEHIAELERMGYKVAIKEKGLESDTDQSTDTSTQSYNLSKKNNSTDTRKNQEGVVAERYMLDYLKENLCYNDMLKQNLYDKDMIDTFFHYLYEAINTTKPTIRVNGENKPREIVVSVLSKLEYFDFLYAVEKYKENTSKVNNQGAYITTLLYNAKAQNEADITNQVQHDMYGQD